MRKFLIALKKEKHMRSSLQTYLDKLAKAKYEMYTLLTHLLLTLQLLDASDFMQ